ncbi:MAG: acetyl-CoA carboxylase biotin carboxyl carrier protein subunit [Kofleriaceae bacterium]
MIGGDTRWRTLEAIAHPLSDGRIELRSPAPGWFRPTREAASASPGDQIGILDMLGRSVRIVVPTTSSGGFLATERRATTRIAVEHNGVIATLDPAGSTAAVGSGGHWTDRAAPVATHHEGLVFASPTSGRFYGRPSPDKPPFVEAGSELTAGTTICLLEVMKTFHRVGYGGGGLPAKARVRAVLISDGTDVNAGDPLIAIEPA